MSINLQNTEIDTHIELPSFIDRPDLQNYGQRTVSSVLFVVGWMGWLYLFLPLLTLFGWAISYQRVNQYIVQNKDGFFFQIQLLGPLVLIMGTLLLLWATYNLIRFRGVSRRTAQTNATLEEIAGHFKIDIDSVMQAQNQQVSIFYFDERGEVIKIRRSEKFIEQQVN